MLSRLISRSVRSLSAVVAVLALVLALAVPIQAAPRDDSSDIGPFAIFVSWLEQLFLPAETLRPDTTLSSTPSPDRAYTSTGTCMDPNGQPVQCPDPD